MIEPGKFNNIQNCLQTLSDLRRNSPIILVMKIEPYSPEIEAQMRNFYQSLSEKDRRRYAAIEAKKLGYGGTSYICDVLQCNDRTIARGMSELETPLPENEKRIRLAGGGRKSTLKTVPELDMAFQRVLEEHTAGSPMDETVKWTNLTRAEIAAGLQAEGFSTSVTVIDQLLDKHNYRRRQAFKVEAGQQVPQRNEQFQNIATLKQQYDEQGNPVMSMDVKKKR